MEEKSKSFELAESREAIDLVPTWDPQLWWIFAAFIVIVIIVFLVALLLRKKTVFDASKEKSEAYLEAKVALSECDELDPRESAIRVSMILRRYLARSMNELALFETHDEFIARHDGLKDLPDDLKCGVAALFSKLAAVKYAPDDIVSIQAHPTFAEAGSLLERIHKV